MNFTYTNEHNLILVKFKVFFLLKHYATFPDSNFILMVNLRNNKKQGHLKK